MTPDFFSHSRFKFFAPICIISKWLCYPGPKLCEWTCLLHIIWPVGEALGQEICLKWLTDGWQLVMVCYSWGYLSCTHFGVPDKQLNVEIWTPTWKLWCLGIPGATYWWVKVCGKFKPQGDRGILLQYYSPVVQYCTVVQNWPTSESNFRPIKTFLLTVLISVVPMTLLYLEPGGRSRAHPDKIYMGRDVGTCKMGKISYKMGFSSPRPLKFLVCAYLRHPRVV